MGRGGEGEGGGLYNLLSMASAAWRDRGQYIFSSVIERVQVESLRDLIFSKSAQ